MDDSIRLLPPALPAVFGGGDITINQMYVQYQILRPAASMFRWSWCTDAASARPQSSPAELSNVIMASHQAAWTLFRFGPSFHMPFPDE